MSRFSWLLLRTFQLALTRCERVEVVTQFARRARRVNSKMRVPLCIQSVNNEIGNAHESVKNLYINSATSEPVRTG
jgi:hypothetical protein